MGSSFALEKRTVSNPSPLVADRERADMNSIVAVRMCYVVKRRNKVDRPLGHLEEPAIHTGTIMTFLNMNIARLVQSWLLLWLQCDRREPV